MTPEELKERAREASAWAKEVHPDDPAAQERWLRDHGYRWLAEIREEARRKERERILKCLRLAKQMPAHRDYILERTFSDAAPSAARIAREVLAGPSGWERSIEVAIV